MGCSWPLQAAKQRDMVSTDSVEVYSHGHVVQCCYEAYRRQVTPSDFESRILYTSSSLVDTFVRRSRNGQVVTYH